MAIREMKVLEAPPPWEGCLDFLAVCQNKDKTILKTDEGEQVAEELRSFPFGKNLV